MVPTYFLHSYIEMKPVDPFSPQVKVVEAELLACLGARGSAGGTEIPAEETCRSLVAAAREELKAAEVGEGRALLVSGAANDGAAPRAAAASGGSAHGGAASTVAGKTVLPTAALPLLELQQLPAKPVPGCSKLESLALSLS